MYVYWGDEGGWCAIGIHTNGFAEGQEEVNGGVRITSEIFDAMQYFRGGNEK